MGTRYIIDHSIIKLMTVIIFFSRVYFIELNDPFFASFFLNLSYFLNITQGWNIDMNKENRQYC